MTMSKALRFLVATLTVTLVSALLAGCGDNGTTKPVDPGTLRGVVQLPYKLASDAEPIEGASVRVTIGDFDSTATTNANGVFIFPVVPAGTGTVTATLGNCLSATDNAVGVVSNITTDITLTLDSEADFDTISVGFTSPIRIELSPDGLHAVLLYDSQGGTRTPRLATVDLMTGTVQTQTISDAVEVYDLKFVNSQAIVVNLLTSSVYCIRFFNPLNLLMVGNDVIYHGAGSDNYGGRLAVNPTGELVFISHTVQDGPNFNGQVYAVSVAQRAMLEADNKPLNGLFALDNTLVGGALGWAYNLVFDPAANELLVGNRISNFITAIDWSKWGTFDRDAGLSMPTEGIRHVIMEPPSPYNQGFGIENFDFAGGVGVASRLRSGPTPIMRYESGGTAEDLYYLEEQSYPSATNHIFRVIPSRDSWFSVFSDDTRGDKRRAIEERSLETLQRTYRFESRYVLNPSELAFAVDPAAGLLYVTYKDRTFIEVFCLP